MIHLRLKTEGSFGQTFAPIDGIVRRLKEIGCTAAGIVDQDSTWMHVAWFEACKKAGIEPMLGVEMVVSDDDTLTRMWFLARDTAGLSELYQATSNAHRQPVSTRAGKVPRMYRLDVEGMSERILKFAGDVTDGEWLARVGARIDLNPSSRVLNMKKKAIAAEFGLPVVSTADNSYCCPEDKGVFELLIAKRGSKGGLKPSPQWILDALENQEEAAVVAEMCAGLTLPKAPLIRAPGNLEELCRQGIIDRKLVWTEPYEKRLQYELELIRSKDFDSYFIVVADMIRFAKQHMLIGPARGSSAGSLVCYLTRITEVDPIPNKLFFERFIDVSRGGWKFNKSFIEKFDAVSATN